MNLIKVTDLSVIYKIGYKTMFALKNISFDVNSGEYICIIGDNGAGKTTLIKSLLSLNDISSGKIEINCKRNEISYLPQNSSIPLDFPATVEEIVLTGTQDDKIKAFFYGVNQKKMANSAMEKARITNLAKRRFGELSGGQQQRVLFARAIAKNPKVLILDEPCTGLDSSTCKDFYKLLDDVNSIERVTIIMVLHDLSAVKKYASKIIALNDNKLAFCGSISNWKQLENSGAAL